MIINRAAAIRRKCTRDSLRFNPKFGAGEDMFAALIQEIDAIDSSYHDLSLLIRCVNNVVA